MNIALILRTVFFPLIRLLSLIVPALKDRAQFEYENQLSPYSESFNKVGRKAEIAFHFSSEGELEIIRPIIDQSLIQGHYVELLFTSPSVEAKVVKLCSLYPEKVRCFRMPLVSFFPIFFGHNNYRWQSADKLLMVRYDFLPELICMKPFLSKFILFAASAKSSSNKDWRFILKRGIYQVFDDIFPTTKEDESFFRSKLDTRRVKIHGPSELRSLQINKRQLQFNFHQNELHHALHDLIMLRPKRLMIAQLWPEELPFLQTQKLISKVSSGELLCYVAPHRFDSAFVAQLRVGLEEIFKDQVPIYFIAKDAKASDVTEISKQSQLVPGVILSCLPGILCELYPLFDKTYVGGGLGKGVHSLLEPFVAGSQIACASNVDRSTEYDIALSLGQDISIINSSVDFESFLSKDDYKDIDIAHFIEDNEKALIGLLRLLEITNA